MMRPILRRMTSRSLRAPLREPSHRARRRDRHASSRVCATAALVAAALLPSVSPVAAADGLTMEARALLQGHARVGSWMAIQVASPTTGHRSSASCASPAAQQSRTRFGTPVDLPTGSRKTYVLYAQPPTLRQQPRGRRSSSTSRPESRRPVDVRAPRPARQLVVGVVAERPEAIIAGSSTCCPAPERPAPGPRRAHRRRPAGAGRGLGIARPPRSGRTSTRST